MSTLDDGIGKKGSYGANGRLEEQHSKLGDEDNLILYKDESLEFNGENLASLMTVKFSSLFAAPTETLHVQLRF